MDAHITVGRQNLQQQLVPSTPAGPATSAPTYIVHQAQQVALTAPPKGKKQAEHWDHQSSSLYRLANVQGPEDLPHTWQTLSPIKKENSQPAFKIACRESAKALRCKAPRVTHAVSVLLLGLHFFIEDPECINDTVNIFQFSNLSLSAGSKDSMVTRIWDTA